MNTVRLVTICSVFALFTSGCVQHAWAPGPGATGNPGQVSGQCKLVSIGAQQPQGFMAASGSPAFVGATMGATALAGIIGSAVRQQNIYNACMEANGYVALPDKPAT